MRRSHLEALRPTCPVCSGNGRASPLDPATVLAEEPEQIVEGILRCTEPGCLSEYPIIDGIPFILSNLREVVAGSIGQITGRDDLSGEIESLLGDCCGPGSPFDTARQQLSSYGWDHWADADPGETLAAQPSDPGGPTGADGRPETGAEALAETVAEAWGSPASGPGSVVRLLESALRLAGNLPPGPILDLGCSVGRVTFELAGRSSDLVLGVDLNVAMLRLASRVLRRGRVRYPRRRAGLVYDLREFAVDPPGAERADFWACDAAALPFPPGRFAAVVGLNLLDSVASPVDALTAIARTLMPGGKALLACPYDWSPGATPAERWVGGHSQRGRWEGSPEAVLRSLLTPGGHPASIEGMIIVAEEQDLPWRVRLHDRGAVDYRCHLIVAERASEGTGSG